jgi:hypothetical protein
MRRKCTKAGCGNNSTGHETLERRLVQLLAIASRYSVGPAFDHVGALPNDVPKLYAASRRTYASGVRQGDLVRTMTAIASTIDDGLSVIFSAEKAQLCN